MSNKRFFFHYNYNLNRRIKYTDTSVFRSRPSRSINHLVYAWYHHYYMLVLSCSVYGIYLYLLLYCIRLLMTAVFRSRVQHYIIHNIIYVSTAIAPLCKVIDFHRSLQDASNYCSRGSMGRNLCVCVIRFVWCIITSCDRVVFCFPYIISYSV